MSKRILRMAIAAGAAAIVLLSALSCSNPSGGSPPPLANNANLKSLVLTAGGSGLKLDAAFKADRITYATSAAYASTGVSITAIAADSGASVTINGVAGTNRLIAFAAAPLSIVVKVTAADGTTTKSYTVTVAKQAAEANADLSALTVSSGKLEPDFNSVIDEYAVYLGSGVPGIDIAATQADVSATKVGDGTFGLVEGANVFPILVTAQDATTTKTYTVTVYRAKAAAPQPSTNSYLTDITASAGALSPAFSYDQYEYDVNVPNAVSSITLTAQTADAGATAVSPATFSLTAGATTTHAFTVTAQAGVPYRRTYTVRVRRAPAASSSATSLTGISLQGQRLDGTEVAVPISGSSPSFSGTVGFNVMSVYLSGGSIPAGATMSDEGGDLAVGSANEYKVKVVAEDGVSTATYTFSITRNAAPSTAAINDEFRNTKLSGTSAPVSGSASAGIVGIRGRLIGPGCSIFAAAVSEGSWTAYIDASATTNGPKILLVYPIDSSGNVAGGISHIPVSVADAAGGPGYIVSGTLGFASSAPTTGTVIVSASPTAVGDDLDPPVAMIVKDLSVDHSFPLSFTLTGLKADEYVIQAMYYPQGSDYCEAAEAYGASEKATISGDASLAQELLLY